MDKEDFKIFGVLLLIIVLPFAALVYSNYYAATRAAEYYKRQGIDITASEIFWGVKALTVKEIK